ncbi:unnamed protein product [Clonostachys byssicola]|uniref:Uncharacterized protein n=1 Tax=Clonostachys byssicola TaxID=160290 RepID=A0A9N9Y2V3_9HYPO|nr:unnamed protein product [Clonostachys byssicola]
MKVTPATKEEIGEENACWLDPKFVADWRASNKARASSGDTQGKGKTKGSQQHHSTCANTFGVETLRDLTIEQVIACYDNILEVKGEAIGKGAIEEDLAIFVLALIISILALIISI